MCASRQQRDQCIDFLSKAINLFDGLRHIKHGEEMYQLAHTISKFIQARSVLSLLDIDPPIIPEGNVLRSDAWFVVKEIFSTVEELRIVIHSTSRSARSFALNRSLGHIIESIKKLKSFSKSHVRFETPIILNVVEIIQEYLFSVSGLIGQIEIKEPIINPYIIGDPVLGNRFIGREDILRQLEELWFINTSPQSVILYGHRRMGKTSILRNATTKVNTEVRVAYVNLLSVSSASNGITDILMAICDALEEITEIPVPSNNDLFQFPETTFRRYLEQITKTFTGKGLIIALDEFEKIEELIDAGKLSKGFLGFLRGMVHMSSKIAFAFAGLHKLQEMNADYFQPFYASFIPISVAFLTRDATHQVLANPDPEFLLEYEPATLDHIYDLTNGQPYLTQLIGFQLVRMFNDYVFEQGKPRDRTFTIDDVRTICSGENFFTTGIHYFKGVWDQAAEGATHQQDILKALAPHPQGLTESELISQTNLPKETLQAALKPLKDHDVIRSQKTNEMVNWAIAVELFRNWVVKYKLNSVDS
ncbi:ATP-binding protein [Pseudanabaena sp. ABRG5-3]|uniref:ATP-binding protein n=1 Tax=Pseudanabaena sp. ABRG5-3 TaxID=685565 RepID=UPI0013A684A5|nr:ATP-binding protein [Pseudanabaena sp. ABRG5-3]